MVFAFVEKEEKEEQKSVQTLMIYTQLLLPLQDERVLLYSYSMIRLITPVPTVFPPSRTVNL